MVDFDQQRYADELFERMKRAAETPPVAPDHISTFQKFVDQGIGGWPLINAFWLVVEKHGVASALRAIEYARARMFETAGNLYDRLLVWYEPEVMDQIRITTE